MWNRMAHTVVLLICVLFASAHGLWNPSIVNTGPVDPETKAGTSYGLVIDLGSKGSRMSVFTWPTGEPLPYTKLVYGGTSKNPWYSKVTPGVATLASNPTLVGTYLKPLLDYADSKVPSSQSSATPIFVKGTDNLRQLDPSVSGAILSNIYLYISQNYNFLIRPGFVSLLPGLLEGGLLWVTVNAAMGNFNTGKAGDIEGTLDMGSGSTQIAFVPKTGTFLPTGYYFYFTWAGASYTPYVQSFTGYGYIAALNAVNMTIAQQSVGATSVHNPCLLAGYSSNMTVGGQTVTMQGTGSWALCTQYTLNYINKTAPCLFTNCSFAGAFQPPLKGYFQAVSNYADIIIFLGLAPEASIDEITQSGIQFCALSWEEARQQYPSTDVADLVSMCFGANYFTSLLGKGYGFDKDFEIAFGKEYNGFPITWAMGEMIYELQNGW